MRTLASIQKIVAINPIQNADKIEVATVLGWECVIAKKDNLKVGDLVVYIEIDSIVPDKPEFEFLRERKFRVRTIKLRGQVSQGLVLPLSVLPNKTWKEGDDVTDIIGVKKYDPEGEEEEKIAKALSYKEDNKIKKYLLQNKWYRKLFLKKEWRGWPKFIAKTDETRIQNFPNYYDRWNDRLFSVTEKLDGQSATYFLVKDGFFIFTKYHFGVCSRNMRRGKPDNSSYWEVAKKYNIESILRGLINNHKFVAIQGEIVGPRIQGNKYGLNENQFFVFNLIYPGTSYPIVSGLAKNILEKEGLNFVPVLDQVFELLPTMQEMVEYSKGRSVINPDVTREGIVMRSGGISFKVINPDFLLEHGL